MKPVFVSKELRQSMKEVEGVFKVGDQDETEKRLEVTNDIIKGIIKKEIEEELSESNEEKPGDTDDENDVGEFEAWKLRELRRIKRDMKEEEQAKREKEEIIRRRGLTDEQRTEENMRLGASSTIIPFKSKMQYMQKYYKKGVFFTDEVQMDTNHILNRDYNLPTGNDRMDKTTLPKCMQVRGDDFGKKGRSKWTDLVTEDTTNHDPEQKLDLSVESFIRKRQGGFKKSKII